MSNTWGQPPAAPGPTPEPWQPPKKRRTGVIVTAAAVAVLVIGGAAAGGWYLFQDDEDGDALAGPAFTTAAESAQDTAQDGTDTASSVTTVTVTASSDADEDDDGADAVSRDSGIDGSGAEPREPGNSSRSGSSGTSTTGDRGSRGLACDGRGVLVVGSVMSNSPSFDQELSATVGKNPGSVVLDPGTCASLRSEVDGAQVYAVVVDYGQDVSGLCAAEAAGGGYSRVLDNQASYRSPC